jgi:hypothetical protein
MPDADAARRRSGSSRKRYRAFVDDYKITGSTRSPIPMKMARRRPIKKSGVIIFMNTSSG